MRLIPVVLICLVVLSCEKEIDIDLNSADSRFVIEGTITDGPGPYFVKISKTVNFSESNDFPPVTEARVFISDGSGVTDTLNEIEPGLYQTGKIVGVPGQSYKLSVEVEGQSITAETTMPEKVPFDGIRFVEVQSPAGDNYSVVPIFTDPEFVGNNYRFVVSINDERYDTYLLINDNVNNGQVNERPLFDPNLEMDVDDVVEVEMRCLDEQTYLYFFALSQIDAAGPGGGTTPSNPPNNFSDPEILGLFSAYTTEIQESIVR